jgi:mycothiol synthase
MADATEHSAAHEAIGAPSVPDAPAIPGLRFRRYRGPDDLPAIVAVLHAGRRADGVDWLPSLDDLRVEFDTLVNEDPQHDMLIAEVDGEVVAFARAAWSLRDIGYAYRSSGEVHPRVRRRGLGTAMLRATQARLREIGAAHEADRPRFYATEAMDGQAGAKALLAAEGYEAVRFFAEMQRSLADPIPEFALPAGLEMRPVRPEDHRRIFDAEAEAFRDHWGNREWTDADFARTFASTDLDTALWRVVWDGDEVVAVTESFIHADENAALGTDHGWLERISTRRPWRGRGVAKAMIVSAMAALRERGMTHAALGVDAENPSGAYALYEHLGFRVANRMEALAKPFDEVPPTRP